MHPRYPPFHYQNQSHQQFQGSPNDHTRSNNRTDVPPGNYSQPHIPPSGQYFSNLPSTGYPSLPMPTTHPVHYLSHGHNDPRYSPHPGAQGYSTVTQTTFAASNGPINYATQPMMPLMQNKKVELSVQGISLKNKDLLSKSDPICILYEKRNGKWAEKDRTEMVLNNLNPQWQKKFCLDYHPQLLQELKFEIYDWDTKATSISKQDFLGSAEVSIQKLVAENYTKGGKCQLPLKNGGHGTIIINAEEIQCYGDTKVKLQLMAHKLDKKDFLGKSDPYYDLKKKLPNGEWTLVYKSEFVEKDVNPKWNTMEKSINEICSVDYNRELKIEIYDHDKRGKDDLIGEMFTSLQSLMAGAANRVEYDVVNPERKMKKKNYTNSGTVSVLQLHFE